MPGKAGIQQVFAETVWIPALRGDDTMFECQSNRKSVAPARLLATHPARSGFVAPHERVPPHCCTDELARSEPPGEMKPAHATQMPGTATGRNRWGLAVALLGYSVSRARNSGLAKAARKCATDSQTA